MNYRNIIEESKIGQITQGSIFNGAKSSAYPNNKDIYGVIITPRCDIAHKNVPLYYYLPAVRLSDWLKVDFPPIYLSKIEKDVKQNLIDTLYKLKESTSIVDKFKAADVENIIRKHNPTLKSSLEGKLEIWKALEKYKNGGSLTDVISKDSSNVRKGILEELLENKNANFYFIESKEEEGFILRMREISRLTPAIMFQLAQGIDNKLTKEELSSNDLRQLDDDDLFMPLYVIRSPFIEHIIQHFLQQFNRIGIEDVSREFVSKINEMI